MLEVRVVVILRGGSDEQKIQGTSGVLVVPVYLIWVLVVPVCSLHEVI